MQWRKTVNIKDLLTDEESPEDVVRIRDKLVRRLQTAFPNPDDDLFFIIEHFEDIQPDYEALGHFNDALNDLYDWADAERIWLGI